MTESTEPHPEKRNWIATTLKIIFFTVAFLLLIFTVMANMGGSSDTLKGAVEDYLHQATGYQAQIGRLNRMSFFPTVGIDIEDVELRRAEGDYDPAITVGRINVAMSFWDMTFSTGKIRRFYIEELSALPGVLTGHAVYIEEIGIEEAEGGLALLEGRGRIGNSDLVFQADMTATGPEEKRKYRFSDKQQVTLAAGDISLQGELVRAGSSIEINNLAVTMPEKFLTGSLIFSAKEGGSRVRVRGDLEIGEVTKLSPNLTFKREEGILNVQGEIKSASVLLSDLGAEGRLFAFLSKLSELLGTSESGDGEIDLAGLDVGIDLEAGKIMIGEIDTGFFAAPLKISESVLQLSPLAGKISEGILAGSLLLDAQTGPASLQGDFKVSGLDYGALQEKFGMEVGAQGNADIALHVESGGGTGEELLRNIDGKATFIAGAGQVETKWLNLWGGGLLNAMLPGFNPGPELTLNCAIMDFKIENGTAKSEALFADTDRITIAGGGTYSIPEDRLDLKLKPKPKDIAIGDIATAVKVTGPVASPSFSPDVFDLGLKIGELLLGTVNPLFLAYSLTDLGLGEQHPCARYIGGNETPATPASP